MQRSRHRLRLAALPLGGWLAVLPQCIGLAACSTSEERRAPVEVRGSGGGASESAATPGPLPANDAAGAAVASGGARGEGVPPVANVGASASAPAATGNVKDAVPKDAVLDDAGAPRDAGLAPEVDSGVALAPEQPTTPRPAVDAGLPPGTVSESDPELERLDALSARFTPLAERTLAFWLAHGPDAAFGGFHATLDRAGAPIAPTNKGLVQQARHLWMLSTWYERREPSREIEQLAAAQYAFLMRFRDPADGAFVLALSRDGRQTVDARKQMYAESFALYALSTYGRVFHVPEAVAAALGRFQSLDASHHDATFGGYDQRSDPGFLAVGAQKDTNTHLHLMEAFSALYEATGDARVGTRLDELAALIATTLRQPSDHVEQEFLLDWTPVGAPRVSYGHDLETSWLLLEAARVLGRPTDPELGAAALAIAENAASHGFDADLGGYFESGPPAADATDLDKVWWVQFEALSGLWWAYELGGGSVQLDRLERTLGWLESTEDRPIGEWFATTNPDGSATGGLDYKGDEWKASYHDVRALVFVQDWIDGERARRRAR